MIGKSHPRGRNFNRDEACQVSGWNSYPEAEISLSCMDWLMMDPFSPTFKWIVPWTSMVMWDRSFSLGQEAYLSATGATKLVSLNALYNEIQWENLEERRKKHKLTLFYKMKSNLCPNYLSSFVPQTVQRYNLRNSVEPQRQKRTFDHVRQAKIQISLRFGAVWSESSLGAFWIVMIQSSSCGCRELFETGRSQEASRVSKNPLV